MFLFTVFVLMQYVSGLQLRSTRYHNLQQGQTILHFHADETPLTVPKTTSCIQPKGSSVLGHITMGSEDFHASPYMSTLSEISDRYEAGQKESVVSVDYYNLMAGNGFNVNNFVRNFEKSFPKPSYERYLFVIAIYDRSNEKQDMIKLLQDLDKRQDTNLRSDMFVVLLLKEDDRYSPKAKQDIDDFYIAVSLPYHLKHLQHLNVYGFIVNGLEMGDQYSDWHHKAERRWKNEFEGCTYPFDSSTPLVIKPLHVGMASTLPVSPNSVQDLKQEKSVEQVKAESKFLRSLMHGRVESKKVEVKKSKPAFMLNQNLSIAIPPSIFTQEDIVPTSPDSSLPPSIDTLDTRSRRDSAGQSSPNAAGRITAGDTPSLGLTLHPEKVVTTQPTSNEKNKTVLRTTPKRSASHDVQVKHRARTPGSNKSYYSKSCSRRTKSGETRIIYHNS